MKTRRIGWGGWVAIAVLVLLLVFALAVLIVPNRLLRSDFLRSSLNKSPESGLLDYESASSRSPGTIHVKNLRFRDRDPKAEWSVELAEADLTYSLVDLLRRRFHVTRATGHGLSFHARNRLTPAEAKGPRARLLPPIAGFPDPPLLSPAPPKSPPTGKEWAVLVENLSVDPVREVWIDDYRFTGDGRLTGGFFLHPHQQAEIYPTELSSETGELRSGKQVLAEDIRAKLAARLPAWDPRRISGHQVLRLVIGKAEANLQLPTAELVNRLIGEPAGTKLEKGRGRMNVKASVERGVATGVIDFDSRDLALRILDVAMRGRFDARMALSGVHLETMSGGRLDRGRLNLTDAVLFDPDGTSHPWWGRIDFARGAFRPNTEALFTTTATARSRDSRPLLRIVGVKIPKWAQKLLNLDEVLNARGSVRIGHGLVEIRRMTARTGKLRIDGDYRAKGSSKSGTFLIDSGLLSVGVGIDGPKTELDVLGPRKWFRERAGWEPAKD
ncbi:MAG: hypothetical protein ABJC28_01410 [Acidobacteriota bacterium]